MIPTSWLQVFEQLKEWLAVETAVASRPPHRSVREGFPHTAPPSGQTIALLSNDTCRGHRATPGDARSGAESGTSTAIRQLFPSVTSFPRRTPLLRSQFCSPVSIVLRSHLNSQQRSCQHCPRRGSLAAQGVIRHAALHLRLMGPSRPVFKRTQARLECLRMHRVFDSAVFVDALP